MTTSQSIPASRVLNAPRAPARSLALGLGLLLLATPLLAGMPPAQAIPLNENALFYPKWSMDKDRNGIDDALDADLADGASGEVWLHVHYDRRPSQADADLLVQQHGAPGAYIFQNWDDIQTRVDYAQVAAIRQAPGVVAVEMVEPPMPDLAQSTGTIRARQATGLGIEEGIDHALAVHQSLGLRGEGMVIAILDTGVDNLHESLDDMDDDPLTDDPKQVYRTNPATGQRQWAGAIVQDGLTTTGCVDPVDDGGHGSHVAGIALGTGGPSKVHQGVAPAAKLVDIDIAPAALGLGQALGFDYIISFNKGLTCFGDPGADRIDVCNLSYGMAGGDNPEASNQRKFTDVVRSGVTCTVSAGNSGSGARTLTKGPEGTIMVADSDNVNTVVRTDDFLSSTSSRGPRVATDGDADPLDQLMPHVAAPGTNILAPGVGTVNQYISFSGTSMAAPHVAGVAALMLQANPSLRPVDKGSNAAMGDVGAVPVRDILIKTAQYKTAVSGPAPQEEAIGRFGQPWNNGWGYGLTDAYAAVRFTANPGQLSVGAGLPQTLGRGDVATFRAQATGGSAPYTFAWAFGDGATASGAVATHAYTAVGVFTATVTATDSLGAQASASVRMTVVSVGIPGVVTHEWTFDNADGTCDAQGWIVRSGRLASASTSKPYASTGGSQWHLVTHQPDTASCAWYHGLDLTRTYTDGGVTQLDSPAGANCLFIPPGTEAVRVTYALAGETETGFDQLQVLVQPGCFEDTPAEAVSSAATFRVLDQVEGTVGDLANGIYVRRVANVDPALPAILAGGGLFQVRFRFYSDPSVNMEGFQLDTIRLHVDNDAPVLAPVGPQTLFTTDDLALALSATDADMDPLTYGVLGAPDGLTVDPLTGAVAWSPGDEQDGVHDVVFTVTDGLFTASQPATITVLNVPPVADGSASTLATDRLTAVRFTDASTDADGRVVAWSWDLGDGTTSAARNPQHTYASLGSFAVTLTVTDDDGATNAASIGTVVVRNLPPAAAVGGATSQANRVEPVQFTDLSVDRDGSIVAWAWAFGDGATSTAQHPSHQYTALGTYTATLTVTDSDGATASTSVPITVVNLLPEASFEVDPRNPTVLFPTRFDATATDADGNVASYHWAFGDGATSTSEDPIHVYLNGGSYQVTLTVTDNDGGVTVRSQSVFVCAPGLDVSTLLELERVRIEYEACLRLNEGSLPL
jgi:PKD repeat protein